VPHGGWLTLDPLASFWVPHPFTGLVKGAGVEFDFAYRPSLHQSALTPHSHYPSRLKSISHNPYLSRAKRVLCAPDAFTEPPTSPDPLGTEGSDLVGMDAPNFEFPFSIFHLVVPVPLR